MAHDSSETWAVPVLSTPTEIAEAGCRGGLITMEWMEEFEQGQIEWALAIDLSAISHRISEARWISRRELKRLSANGLLCSGLMPWQISWQNGSLSWKTIGRFALRMVNGRESNYCGANDE